MSQFARQSRRRYRAPKGGLYGRRYGSKGKFESYGNLESCEITIEQTTQDYPTNEDSDSTPAFTDVTATTVTVTFVTRNSTDFIEAQAICSGRVMFEQPIIAAESVTVPAPIEEFDVIELGGRFMTNVTGRKFTAGGVDFVEGTHFKHDKQAGMIQIIAIPAAYDETQDGTLNYTAEAYSAVQMDALSEGALIDMEYIFRYTNAQGLKQKIKFHHGQQRPDGAQGTVLDTDLGTRGFTTTLLKDATVTGAGYFTATNLPELLIA